MESLSYVNGVQEAEHVQQTNLEKDLKPFHSLYLVAGLVAQYDMPDKDKFCL